MFICIAQFEETVIVKYYVEFCYSFVKICCFIIWHIAPDIPDYARETLCSQQHSRGGQKREQTPLVMPGPPLPDLGLPSSLTEEHEHEEEEEEVNTVFFSEKQPSVSTDSHCA